MSTIKKKTFGYYIIGIISILFALFYLIPIIWSLFCSIKVEGTQIKSAIDWFKPPYTIANYIDVIVNSAVTRWLFNSIILAVITVILNIVLTSLAAYPLAKMKFKGSKIIYLYLLLGLIVPGEATIIPLFTIVNKLGLLDTYIGLFSPIVATSMNLLIVVSFFAMVPKDMIESAKIDGAKEFTIFSQIIIPLSKSVLVTISIFSFMGSWNNYLWPLLCSINDNMFTLPVGIPTFSGTYTIDYVKPMTANMIASIPAIIIYIIFEKKIVEGVALTGIKG